MITFVIYNKTTDCKKIANAMFLTVKKLGCTAYKNAQSESCYCLWTKINMIKILFEFITIKRVFILNNKFNKNLQFFKT